METVCFNELQPVIIVKQVVLVLGEDYVNRMKNNTSNRNSISNNNSSSLTTYYSYYYYYYYIIIRSQISRAKYHEDSKIFCSNSAFFIFNRH